MWCIWKERNARLFEGSGKSVVQLKLQFMRSFADWMATSGPFGCSNLIDFLDLCSNWFCILFLVHVQWFFSSIKFYLSKKKNRQILPHDRRNEIFNLLQPLSLNGSRIVYLFLQHCHLFWLIYSLHLLASVKFTNISTNFKSINNLNRILKK